MLTALAVPILTMPKSQRKESQAANSSSKIQMGDHTDQKIKVLYIAGWGRSGSTLLGRILGEVDRFFYAGELRTIWVDGFKPSGRCGCGVPVQECSIWKSVVETAFGTVDVDPVALTQLRYASEPKTHEVLLAQFLNRKRQLQTRLTPYVKTLNQLYEAIQAVTGCSVIVDDSLHPGHAYSLASSDRLEVYILHLVRDPRATAYSWWKRQKKGLGTYTIRQNAVGWLLRNLATEAIRTNPSVHYLRFHYEDFAAQPQASLQKVLAMMQVPDRNLPFTAEGTLNLGVNHSVFGNPNRLSSGPVTIRLDDEWQRQLDASAKLKVTAYTLPLLLKYGYNPLV